MGYYNKLVKKVEADKSLNQTLEQLISTQKGGVFNLAAQIWNHSFYWNSLNPKCVGSKENNPTGKIADKIKADFGSFEEFKNNFPHLQVILEVGGRG
eukprot:UN32850